MTTRRVIFTPHDYWTHPPKENTVTHEPAFIVPPTRELGLPVDTFPITGTEAVFFLTADGQGKLIPQLALETEELGWYRITFAADTFKALLAQAAGLANMTAEQTNAIARQLHGDDAS
jgi:hypothetical protein